MSPIIRFLAALAIGLDLATLTGADGFRVVGRTPAAFTAAAPDQVVSSYAVLQKTSGISRSSMHLKAIQKNEQNNGSYSYGTAPLQLVAEDTVYLIPIKFASTAVQVVLDTGSSDTWLARADFQCVDANQAPVPESNCMFGPLFNGTFEYGQIPNENFNITYGDGEFLIGTLGYEDVTIAGIDVKHQEVALVYEAYWFGDGISSGLTGLAYAALTSAFLGTDPSKDDYNTTQIEYSPIFQTMYTEGLSPPMFSLALERGSAGYIAFGGLPPVQFVPDFASTPIRIIDLFPEDSGITQFSFYTIIPDGFVYKGSRGSQMTQGSWPNPWPTAGNTFPVIIDSGTTTLAFPPNMTAAINALFEPPAVFLQDEGAYFVQCNATAPAFGVTISGKTFNINPVDLIFQKDVDPSTGLCLTGVQSGGSGPYILGDVFLQNVVAVFDVGAAEMRFAAHEYY